jgi:predicted ABC-type transport system involved in lysophospholipase L1 biosynthesis ATPase subunit
MFVIEIKKLICLSGGKQMSELFKDQNQYAQKFGLPLIQVEHLSRVIETRTQKTTILDDVTFTVPTQSLFAINGPSGSGKSTLLNMLTGIDRPSNGRIVFAGEELRKMN